MKLAISSIEDYEKYLHGVEDKIEHHAGNVRNPFLVLASVVPMIKDEDEPILVFQQDGEIKNVAWIKIKGERYAFSYNHIDDFIEIRERTTRGKVLLAINNQSEVVKEIYNFFDIKMK
jgi:hypothetical protein